MLEVMLNNQCVKAPANATLAQALNHWGYRKGPFAVALNRTFVPRTRYDSTPLHDGDQIEVVAPIQGG